MEISTRTRYARKARADEVKEIWYQIFSVCEMGERLYEVWWKNDKGKLSGRWKLLLKFNSSLIFKVVGGSKKKLSSTRYENWMKKVGKFFAALEKCFARFHKTFFQSKKWKLLSIFTTIFSITFQAQFSGQFPFFIVMMLRVFQHFSILHKYSKASKNIIFCYRFYAYFVIKEIQQYPIYARVIETRLSWGVWAFVCWGGLGLGRIFSHSQNRFQSLCTCKLFICSLELFLWWEQFGEQSQQR